MRISKGTLWKLGVPAGLLLATLALSKLWIRSDAAHLRVRTALSQALGMEVRFEKLQTSFQKGLRIKAPAGSSPSGSSFQGREIQLRPSLLHLFLGRLVLREIRLDAPRMVWVEKNAPQQEAAPAENAPVAHAPNPLNALLHGQLGGKKVVLQGLVLENGDFQCISASGQSLLHVEGVSLQIRSTADGDGQGRLGVAKGTLAEVLSFHALQAPLLLEKGTLKIPNLSAKSGGGQFSASAVFPRESVAPFQIQASLQNVDLSQLSEEISTLRMSGILNAQVDLHGKSLLTADLEGSGSAQVKDGFFKGLSLFQILGQIFQIQELANLKIQSGSTQFTIANRQILLHSLTLQSDNLLLEAPGSIGFDKQLALNARLRLPEKMLKSKNIQGFLGRFSPPDSEGNQSIDFQVSGTSEKPRTNLLEKIVSGGAGNVLQQVLSNFLKPKSSPKTNDSPGSAPDATPPPTDPQPQNR